jgi:hypothetical protein
MIHPTVWQKSFIKVRMEHRRKHLMSWIGPAEYGGMPCKRDASTSTRGAGDSYPQFRRIRPRRIRYYGYYSNKLRGLRKKAGTDDQIPALIESEISSKEFRQNWARLIQKIYPVKFPKGNPIEQGK